MFSFMMFRRAPGSPASQSVGATPWTYTNSSNDIQIVSITGGAVLTIELNAGSGFNLQVGILGNFVVFPNQSLRIAYLVTPPTVTVTQL